MTGVQAEMAGEGAAGRGGDDQGCVGEELGGPSGGVKDLVVTEAERGEVGGVGGAEFGPGDDVVDLAVVD